MGGSRRVARSAGFPNSRPARKPARGRSAAAECSP